jgi:hypothetical protein
VFNVADSELELRQAMRELEAAVGQLNAAMLRASEAGMRAGEIASVTGISLGRVYRNVRAQRKGKP